MTNWDARFIELARLVSTWSKDPSTKVGAVIIGEEREIVSVGYNGFPRGVADDERLNDRDRKYQIIVHAEENCILNATRTGARIKDCTCYVLLPPCVRCARMLIQVGIREVVSAEYDIPDRWREDMTIAQAMLREAKVSHRVCRGAPSQLPEVPTHVHLCPRCNNYWSTEQGVTCNICHTTAVLVPNTFGLHTP